MMPSLPPNVPHSPCSCSPLSATTAISFFFSWTGHCRARAFYIVGVSAVPACDVAAAAPSRHPWLDSVRGRSWSRSRKCIVCAARSAHPSLLPPLTGTQMPAYASLLCSLPSPPFFDEPLCRFHPFYHQHATARLHDSSPEHAVVHMSVGGTAVSARRTLTYALGCALARNSGETEE